MSLLQSLTTASGRNSPPQAGHLQDNAERVGDSNLGRTQPSGAAAAERFLRPDGLRLGESVVVARVARQAFISSRLVGGRRMLVVVPARALSPCFAADLNPASVSSSAN